MSTLCLTKSIRLQAKSVSIKKLNSIQIFRYAFSSEDRGPQVFNTDTSTSFQAFETFLKATCVSHDILFSASAQRVVTLLTHLVTGWVHNLDFCLNMQLTILLRCFSVYIDCVVPCLTNLVIHKILYICPRKKI